MILGLTVVFPLFLGSRQTQPKRIDPSKAHVASLVDAAKPNLETLYTAFRNPSPEYSISPYWFWNGKVTAKETRRQINEMVRQEVRSAVIMNWAGLEPAYLSEPFWREVGVALDAARDAGMTLNFSDEFLWPSGQAWDYASLNREPSRVLQLHPEYRMRRLTCRQIRSGESTVLDADAEVVVAARVDASGAIDKQTLTLLPAARIPKWKAPAADWRLFVYTPIPSFERGVRVDLLNPAAVKVFIDLVYGEFARRFPRHLGSTIKFFVSDHEGAYGSPLPFTPALWEAFRKRHGYDLRRFLPLADQLTPQAAKIRRDYLDTIARLYAASFVQQITDWCTRHGVRHGHSDIEESLRFQVMWTGDMFRLWRASSAVYVDALLDRARMPVDFQEAESVAHFEDRPFMVENQGLTGYDSFWSMEKARLGTNMCLLWGVTRLIPHYFEYDPGHIQYPPSWFLTQPLWRYFHHYADMARRGLFMNSAGRHNSPIAVYYPLESAFAASDGLFKETGRSVFLWHNQMDQTQDYYSALQLELARQGWEYHILDSHYLRKAELFGSKLQLAGEQFRVLLLPPMTDIAPESADQIRRFARAGGVVIALGFQPPALEGINMRRFPIHDHGPFMDRLDYTVQIQVPEPVRADLAPVLEAIRAVQPPVVEILSGSRDHLFFSRRFTADAEWYWAVNDTSEPRQVKARFPFPGVFEKWDAETGARTTLAAQGSVLTLDFGPWDGYFVVRHSGRATAPPIRTGTRRVLLELPSSGWQFTPESPVPVPYAKAEGSAEPVWLAPERLANRDWWLAGPYPYGDHQGFFDAFPPEKGFDASDPAWKWFESPTFAVRPPVLFFGSKDFDEFEPPTIAGRTPVRNGVFYAYVNVWSPAARQGCAAVAAADSVKLWWNGKLELARHLHPPFVNLRDPWSYRPRIDIRKGWNFVLLKIGPNPMGATGFLFRITDKQENTMRDIVYARDRKLPPPHPRRVRLTVEAPPGTDEKSLSIDMDENEIPERPVTFAPRTTPFTLASWTDSTLANYSGSALYETTFRMDAVPAGESLILDLGEVGLSAEVWLNGQKAGERAWRPFELDITPFARRGVNRLKIRVANSNAGWMAQGPPIYGRDAWSGLKFESERDRLRTLRPNGLEGPVRILSVKPERSR